MSVNVHNSLLERLNLSGLCMMSILVEISVICNIYPLNR